ncbi:hypothetical protein PM082_009492 [Marasmius tenuissimus]|nr:hypothetical protein PM082_009492 [Marasmius tenuissimus]
MGWYRDDSTEPFDIALVYKPTDNRSSATQTLASNVQTTRDEHSVQHGTVTFMATATGKIHLVAVKSAGGHLNTLLDTDFKAVASNANGTTDSGSRNPSSNSSDSRRVSDSTPTPTPIPIPTAQHTSPPTFTAPMSESPSMTPIEPSIIPLTERTREDDKNIIIPSVIGGCTMILVVFLVWFFLRRRQRRKKDAPSEEFRREMMALTGVDPMPPVTYHQTGYSRVRGAAENDRDVDPTSSTTPLREDFEGEQDDGSSQATSSYSRTSAGTQAPGASDRFGRSEPGSEGVSEVPMLPLIPVSSNLTLSTPEPRTPFRAMTDRQMEIEQKIIKLQGRLITTSGPGQEKSRMRAELMNRIEKLKTLRQSDWAYGSEGKVPSVLNE